MRKEIAVRKIRLCEPKTVLLNAQFNTLQNVYSGQCVLDYRIERVLAMRIKYFNVTVLGSDISAQNSTIMLLGSGLLGSNLSFSSYKIATSLDSTGQIAQTQSNIIGWMVRDTGSTNTGASQIGQSSANNLHRFSTPIAIEHFDWFVQPLNALFPSPLGHAFCVEAVFEFFPECLCQSYVHNEYSL